MADHITGEQRYYELLGDLEKADMAHGGVALGVALVRTDLVRNMLRDLRGCMQQDARDAWADGWDTAGRAANNELDRYAELVAQVAVAMRGKDRGDGYIALSVYPDPAIYDWTP